MLPRFEIVDRFRPVGLLAPGGIRVDRAWPSGTAPVGCRGAAGVLAPYAAVVVDLDHAELAGRLELGWTGPDGERLIGWYDGGRRLLGIDLVDSAGTRSRHRSRRFGRPDGGVGAMALTLTGTHLAVWTSHRDKWTARARIDLSGAVETRSEAFLGRLEVGYDWQPRYADPAPVTRLRAGAFGQLGLRDLHVVTQATGEPVRDPDGRLLLTATHAGPSFFDTGHTGVWSFDPDSRELAHRADLYFRRPDRPGVFGDHATHLVRDGEEWLVAASTWGDFDRTTVGVILARTTADLTTGEHVLDTEVLGIPSDAVGVWDPHLTRIEGVWHVAYVAARKFFDFHPGLCRGNTLDTLAPVAEDHSRSATEGTSLVEIDGRWWVVASDGRDNPRDRRAAYPIYDLDLTEAGALDAPYPSNIPWPTIWREGDGWLMLTFDGSRYGGDLLGYGTHGGVVLMQSRP